MEVSGISFFDVKKLAKNIEGRTIPLVLILGLVFVMGVAGMSLNFEKGAPQSADAQANATTSVTVLNSSPNWTASSSEFIESSTSSPTNVGVQVKWVGTGTDDNGDPYYLLICSSTSSPSAATSGPTCGGGDGNRWAVSASTTSGVQASTTYTTTATDTESNVWAGWICDYTSCNVTYTNGTTATNTSPFVVNHRPTFTAFTDSSPFNPGGSFTFQTTSTDPDTFGGQDQVRLFACKANDFTGTACGAGGTWCSSATTTDNASCTATTSVPVQDGTFGGFGFIIDEHAFAATGGQQGSDTGVVVNNVPSTISTSSISLVDAVSSTSSLTLTVPQGETTRFKVKLTIVDDNSCLTTATTSEITAARIHVFRSGILLANCIATSTYNPNNCYPGTVSTSVWNTASSTQDSGTCSGASDPDVTWTTEFPLWYIADPTDGANATDSQFFAETWKAAVEATDNNNATSGLVEGFTGNDVLSLLAYDVTQNTLNFGSLAPGQRNDPLIATTTTRATGNVGLDETLYGSHMCTNYSTSTECTPTTTTSTIVVTEQRYATSALAYASGTPLQLNPGANLNLNVKKTTATGTPQTADVIWGVNVPATITLSGSYTGRNTIVGIKGNAQEW